jgi:hypothetical protein
MGIMTRALWGGAEKLTVQLQLHAFFLHCGHSLKLTLNQKMKKQNVLEVNDPKH